MKLKHLLISAILSLGFQAQADEAQKWLIGTQYSFHSISFTPNREPETIGLIGGYRISEYFALEARYSFDTSGYSSAIFVNGEQEEYKEEIDTHVSLLLKAYYPVFNSINLYLLAGFSESKYKITTSSSFTDLDGNTAVTYPAEINFSESGFTYGLGLDYRLNDKFLVFVDFEILPDIKVGSDRTIDWSATNIGVKYSF